MKHINNFATITNEQVINDLVSSITGEHVQLDYSMVSELSFWQQLRNEYPNIIAEDVKAFEHIYHASMHLHSVNSSTSAVALRTIFQSVNQVLQQRLRNAIKSNPAVYDEESIELVTEHAQYLMASCRDIYHSMNHVHHHNHYLMMSMIRVWLDMVCLTHDIYEGTVNEESDVPIDASLTIVVAKSIAKAFKR